MSEGVVVCTVANTAEVWWCHAPPYFKDHDAPALTAFKVMGWAKGRGGGGG